MKALALLKEDRDYCLTINNDQSIIQKYDEAIEELEDLKNRSCVTCKYGIVCKFDDEAQCFIIGANTQGLCFEKDFYCKHWKSK